MSIRPNRTSIIIASALLAIIVTVIWTMFSPSYEGGEPSQESAKGGGEVECQLENLSQETKTIAGRELTVHLAQSPEQRSQGLSACTEIPAGKGMLFVFAKPKEAAFWMKDMVMPIDIVWLKDGQVVGIESNVQPPAEGTPDQDLVVYQSPGEVDSVLEVTAGQAEKILVE